MKYIGICLLAAIYAAMIFYTTFTNFWETLLVVFAGVYIACIVGDHVSKYIISRATDEKK